MKLKLAITTKVLYKSYCERCKLRNVSPISYTRYFNIVQSAGRVYQGHFLELGIVGLPHGVGDTFVKVISSNPRNRILQTAEGNKMIPMLSDNTENKGRKIFWYNRDKKKNKGSDWVYVPVRDFKRSFSALLMKQKVYPDYAKMIGLK